MGWLIRNKTAETKEFVDERAGGAVITVEPGAIVDVHPAVAHRLIHQRPAEFERVRRDNFDTKLGNH